MKFFLWRFTSLIYLFFCVQFLFKMCPSRNKRATGSPTVNITSRISSGAKSRFFVHVEANVSVCIEVKFGSQAFQFLDEVCLCWCVFRWQSFLPHSISVYLYQLNWRLYGFWKFLSRKRQVMEISKCRFAYLDSTLNIYFDHYFNVVHSSGLIFTFPSSLEQKRPCSKFSAHRRLFELILLLVEIYA